MQSCVGMNNVAVLPLEHCGGSEGGRTPDGGLPFPEHRLLFEVTRGIRRGFKLMNSIRPEKPEAQEICLGAVVVLRCRPEKGFMDQDERWAKRPTNQKRSIRKDAKAWFLTLLLKIYAM